MQCNIRTILNLFLPVSPGSFRLFTFDSTRLFAFRNDTKQYYLQAYSRDSPNLTDALLISETLQTDRNEIYTLRQINNDTYLTKLYIKEK